MVPYASFSRASVETALQVGYSVADIVAKAGVGVLIYLIASRKSAVKGYNNAASDAALVRPAGA